MGYRPAVPWRRPISIIAMVAVLLSSCGSEAETNRFGPVVSGVDEIVGTELMANRVVSLPCIPSRRDPVGVWLAMQVVGAEVAGDMFTLDLLQTDARLGSHPSGCRNPGILLAQSVFLFDGSDPVFAQEQGLREDSTRLVFALADRDVADFDLVVLPTLGFETGDGMAQTTIFGLIGRFSLG